MSKKIIYTPKGKKVVDEKKSETKVPDFKKSSKDGDK